MLLAGDIGGTKTLLALFSPDQPAGAKPVHAARFASSAHNSLEEIIALFLRETGISPIAASFGVAGPVKNGQAHITNLPWTITAANIGRAFNIPHVFIQNDLEAIAVAVPHLKQEELVVLNKGTLEPRGNIAIIAPGTGLGVGFLTWAGREYKAWPSEGGHTTFAPRTAEQIELLKFLHHRYDHVSFERICSGGYLPNIYDFFLETGGYSEPDWLKKQLNGASDRTPVIIQHGLTGTAAICTATVDMFVLTLGTMISNMAVTLLPTGGIFLGGGIPPRILPRLRQPDFFTAITDKGRFSELCAQFPLKVIVKPETALHGAARHGVQMLKNST